MAKPILDIDAMARELQVELKAIGRDIQAGARDKLRENKTNASGTLSASIVSDLQRNVGGFQVSIGPTVSYGAHVEFGTKPHMPPVDALKAWLLDKYKGAIHGPELSSIAWAVAISIRAKGTRAQPYMEPVFAKFQREIPGRLANAAIRKI